MREHVTAGRQPWLKAYLDMRDSRYGSYRHRAKPYGTVVCPAGDPEGRGCAEERADALAAYTQALLFSVTGRRQHAEKARQIMDAWSGTPRRHTGANAVVQADWTGSVWARAGEIVRHTRGGGWPAARVQRFEGMLRTISPKSPRWTRTSPGPGTWWRPTRSSPSPSSSTTTGPSATHWSASGSACPPTSTWSRTDPRR
ncbi:hypothetical protein ABZ568_11950 [Streptomyces olindensis]|uniref:Uncharacterized protein n=1 Tax=Streptomyces olindensis TaxID=358823 RepID=A0ABV2XSZ4_9ACTN